MLVILKSTIVDDIAIPKRQMVGGTARGEQEFVVGVLLSFVIPHKFLVWIERGDLTVQMKLGDTLLGRAPDLFYRLALPQAFGKIGAHVGWVWLQAEHTDGTLLIQLTDALRSAIPSQPTADDQILEVLHLILLKNKRHRDEWQLRRTKYVPFGRDDVGLVNRRNEV